MKRSALVLTLGALLAMGGLAAGCGGEDQVADSPTDTGMTDSSKSETTPLPDTGTDDTGTADTMVTDTPVDADAGPLDFADFVKGLISTETKSTTVPTTVDDKTFVDKQDQAQFKELFP